MKYKELKEPCKSCLGCIRLENSNFISDPYCRWQEKKDAKYYINKIKNDLKEKE